MKFTWPIALLLLVILGPLLWYVYLLQLRRRERRVGELAAKGFSPTSAVQQLRKRRHIPYMFFFAGLLTLIASIARPKSLVDVPNREGTVILAFDVSNSMRADDLKPSRLEAAKVAALKFVEKQPTSIKIGVVAFSDSALVTQQPTKDKEVVKAALKRLAPQGGTSLGRGMLTSIGAISGKAISAPGVANSADPNADPAAGADPATGAVPANDPTLNPDAQTGTGLENLDIPYLGSSAIVMLSDGENTGDPDPIEVAKLASTAGVKVFTIGVGSPDPTVLELDGFRISTQLDEAMLTEIAKTASGTYEAASDAKALTGIYEKIDLKWESRPEELELTGIMTAVAIGLLAIGAALSLRWYGRLV